MSLSSDTKIFGRYHEIGLMLCGFILTTLLGGILTFWYQKQAWEREDLSNRRNDQILRASEAFEEISKIIDKRLFRFRLILNVLEWDEDTKTTKEALEARDRYLEVIHEWNENLYGNLAKVEIHFGKEARNTFEQSIMPKFVNLHKELILAQKNSATIIPENITQDIEELRPVINDFNIAILSKLQEGNVGSFIKK